MPSALGIMTGCPPRNIAAAELDVPKSIPMIDIIIPLCISRALRSGKIT